MDQHRRNFLKAAAPLFIPARVFGANDRPQYALIGCGGRGRYLNPYFQKAGTVPVALCDVYEPYLQQALEASPGAKTWVDYRELLEQATGVDFVVLAGPDHHHCPMLLESLGAGKDVYAEKPLSRTLEESATMVNAVRKSDRVVQIGMQRRSAPALLRAKKLVDDGILGQITMVKPQWFWNIAHPENNTPLPGKLDWDRFVGPAPKRPFQPMRFRSWRHFRDYAGGNMTDQGTHLMDVVQWFTNSGPPKSAVGQGFVGKFIGAEYPDVFTAVFEMDGFLATWSLDYCNSFEEGWRIVFMGDKGTMILDETGYRVYAERWTAGAQPVHAESAPVPVETHVANFLDCIRSRRQPNCTVEIAQRAVAGPHLANIAMDTGRRAALAADLVTVT